MGRYQNHLKRRPLRARSQISPMVQAAWVHPTEETGYLGEFAPPPPVRWQKCLKPNLGQATPDTDTAVTQKIKTESGPFCTFYIIIAGNTTIPTTPVQIHNCSANYEHVGSNMPKLIEFQTEAHISVKIGAIPPKPCQTHKNDIGFVFLVFYGSCRPFSWMFAKTRESTLLFINSVAKPWRTAPPVQTSENSPRYARSLQPCLARDTTPPTTIHRHPHRG